MYPKHDRSSADLVPTGDNDAEAKRVLTMRTWGKLKDVSASPKASLSILSQVVSS